MNGNAVMYDAGKLLTLGGAPAYQNSTATSNAYTVDIRGTSPVVEKVPSMANARAFANSVVLPDGKVLVVGGQAYAVPFSDATAVLTPELWDPATKTFTAMAPMTVPRDYHSFALLLPDGRVLAGGGQLVQRQVVHVDGEDIHHADACRGRDDDVDPEPGAPMSFEYLIDPATGPQWQGVLPGKPQPSTKLAGGAYATGQSTTGQNATAAAGGTTDTTISRPSAGL